MTHSRFLKYIRYAAWVCLVLALFCTVTQWIWDIHFAQGNVGGIYWLFIVFDRIILPLTGFLSVSFLLTLMLWIVRMLQRKPRHWHVGITAGILLLASLCSLLAIPPTAYGPWTTVDSSHIHGATYYLVAMQAFIDTNYGLVRCDRLGVVCELVYLSGDIEPPPNRIGDASLTYDGTTDTLSVTVEEEVIYNYQP